MQITDQKITTRFDCARKATCLHPTRPANLEQSNQTGGGFNAYYTATTLHECLDAAKKDGWTLHQTGTLELCPTCSRQP